MDKLDLYEITHDDDSVNIELSDGSNLRLRKLEASNFIKRFIWHFGEINKLKPAEQELYDELKKSHLKQQ